MKTRIGFVYVCLYVCVYVCMYICMFGSSGRCIDSSIHCVINTCLCVCVCVWWGEGCMCVCGQQLTGNAMSRQCVYVCRCRSVCVCVQVWVCVCVCRSVCVCVGMSYKYFDPCFSPFFSIQPSYLTYIFFFFLETHSSSFPHINTQHTS